MNFELLSENPMCQMLRQHGAGFAGVFIELAVQCGADKRLIYMKIQEEVVNRISRTFHLIPQELRFALS